MEGRGKWWRAIAGLLIRFTVCKTVVIIILNAPSVKLTAWIPTFISNIIDRLSIVRGAQWQIMGYVLLLGVWILPQCNYAMLILLPYTMHLPWQKQGLPTVRMSQTGGEVKYEWINVLVCVLAVPTKTRALPPFLPFSSGAHRRGGGGGSLSWSPVAVFPETGSNAGQATLNSSAGFIVSEVDRVRPCASSATPPSLNTRTQLASDMEQTLAARTNPCHALWGEPCWGQRSRVKGEALLWHDLNTDWFFSSGCRGREGGRARLVMAGRGHVIYPYPMWRCGVRECGTKERRETPRVITCLTPLCTSAGVCFHFLWNKTLDHMFSLLIDSWVEKGQECGLFARWSLGCWHLVEGMRPLLFGSSC